MNASGAMSSPIVQNQQRTLDRLWRSLRPSVRTDRDLPARIKSALSRREFGARDRRLYRELLYTLLRYLPWIEELEARAGETALRAAAWLSADAPATRAFREELVPDWPPLPATIAGRAAHLGVGSDLLPAWFREHCPAAFVSPNLEALHARAHLWIRLQTEDPAPVFADFADHGWSCRPSEILPQACQLPGNTPVISLETYRDGRFEIQDLGSQLVLASIAIAPGGRWLDACAGAGGKTLQLARLLGRDGRVDAHDIRAEALAELETRARRAHLTKVRVAGDPAAAAPYDGVLVDDPCSGSGTWRREPHLKWSTTPAVVAAQAARQRELLAHFAGLVRPGGLLVYATCSLSRHENEDVVAAFLSSHPKFAMVPPARPFSATAGATGLTILPAQHDSDGFFVAALRRAP